MDDSQTNIQFVAQTDVGVYDATSYVSLEEANQLYRNNLYDDHWNTMTDDIKMRALNTATLYLDSKYLYIGSKKDIKQRLQFPRVLPYYYDGDSSGNNGIVPVEIKLATTLLAESLSRGGNKFIDNQTINIGEAKVGELESKFTGVKNPIIPKHVFIIISKFVYKV